MSKIKSLLEIIETRMWTRAKMSELPLRGRIRTFLAGEIQISLVRPARMHSRIHRRCCGIIAVNSRGCLVIRWARLSVSAIIISA